MKTYDRICPNCNKTITYSYQGYYKAIRYNRVCKSCSISIINRNRTEVDKLNRNLSIINVALGRKVSEETRQKMSVAHRGKPMPVGTGEKISKALKGKPKSDVHKMNLRYAKIKDLKSKFGEKLGPNYNSNACKLFEILNNKFGWDGKHAENGGEIIVCGYWLDFYEPNINLAIEYDEIGHKYRIAQDIKKQKEIINELGCKFIRINETDTMEMIYNKIKEVV